MRIGELRRQNGAVLLIGSATLIAWVLFGFATKSINFDLVGQQLLARQWLEGNAGGSLVGPTNYIVKIFFVYMPAELLAVDQKIFLLFSAILINILTFVGMFVVLRQILGYFSVKASDTFALSMLWLTTVAGSVFWVQFTNSRNLEVLAGLCLLYVGLLLYKELSFRLAIIFLLLAGVTYFSDPLQLFVTTTVLLLYVSLHSFLFEKEKYKTSLAILLLVVGGYALSRLLVLLVHQITGVELLATNIALQGLLSANAIPVTIIETSKNILRLIAGTNEMGVWRQIMNIVFVSFMAGLSAFLLIKNKTYKKQYSLVLFLTLMLLMPIAVYMASGQALFREDTSRYLIMLAPALMLLFSCIDTKSAPARLKRAVVAVALPVLLLGIGSLFYVSLRIDGGNVFRTTHLEERYAYLEREGYSYGYASMDTAIPAMYLLGRGSDRVLLPLACEGGVLRKSTLFYDKNIFSQNEQRAGIVPIILDGNAISNYPSDCTPEKIQAQFGVPLGVDVSGGNTVLIYTSKQLENLHH